MFSGDMVHRASILIKTAQSHDKLVSYFSALIGVKCRERIAENQARQNIWRVSAPKIFSIFGIVFDRQKWNKITFVFISVIELGRSEELDKLNKIVIDIFLTNSLESYQYDTMFLNVSGPKLLGDCSRSASEFEEFIVSNLKVGFDTGVALEIANIREPYHTRKAIKKHERLSRGQLKALINEILPVKFDSNQDKLDILLPVFYLKGFSPNQFENLLRSFRQTSVDDTARFISSWKAAYQIWSHRDLSQKNYLYWWVDAVMFENGFEEQDKHIFVLIGALQDGQKELVAITEGNPDNKLHWLSLLRDLKARGLKFAPGLAIGDGNLQFWAALRKEYPTVREQRCWAHKIAEVRSCIHNIYFNESQLRKIPLANSKNEAQTTIKDFILSYGNRFPEACAHLTRDHDKLLKFYNFPRQHWRQIDTANVVTQIFRPIRRNKIKPKIASQDLTLISAFQFCRIQQSRWSKITIAHSNYDLWQWLNT